MAKADLTSQRLRELLHYDPETGAFTWLATAGKARAGGRAGDALSHGYNRIGIDGHVYLAHRLAWFYVYGIWPSGEIDHINGNRIDNRMVNLRDVPRRLNRENLRSARSDNQTGVLGVAKNGKSSWQARIKVNGVRHSLGTYGSPEEAHQAYLKAKRKLHDGCTI
jgi:hypothetical protein